ncbi:MAG: LacI family DNA-binding transcriptional regulator [Acidobacteriota bacterium]|nr:LacI family DNA-binding transcriptional regulator [Acidobacteriota bacterium]
MKSVPAQWTIRDVAREASVGVGTVSRVLNGGVNVSPETSARVHAAIKKLDFRPHAQARRILRKHSGMVCFLLTNRAFMHSFHARILQGVENCARALKQHVIYAVGRYEPDTPPGRIMLPPILQERGWVDGLILTGLVYGNFLQRIQSLHIPFVALGNNVVTSDGAGDFDSVAFDEFKGVSEATKYLISQGHRRIMFAGDISFPWFKERYRGYLAAMRAHKLKPIGVTTQSSTDFSEFGEMAAAQLLATRPRPTAVMAGNDEIAYGVWRGLRRSRIAVPADVSLVGFDDREEARLMDPPLTTVRVHKEEIGDALMRLLLDKLHHGGPPFTRRILSTELVTRESVRTL